MTQNNIHATSKNNQPSAISSKTPSTILRQSIKRTSFKFSSSQRSSQLKSIDLAIYHKRCRLLDIMKDQDYNKQGQVLQKYAPLKEEESQLTQLIEYYKYYTQTSIIYQPLFFKLMHQYRESKKEVEYNRLKIMLHLSSTSENSEQQQQKSNYSNLCSTSSLFILPKLSVSKIIDEQSQVIVKLSSKLERNLGPNCFRTVQELDRNYNFQKKRMDNTVDVNLFKKITFSSEKEKENLASTNTNIKNHKMHHKRNSCEQINAKKPIIKPSSLHKKKQLSMDNINNLVKDYCNQKQRKPKIIQNGIKKSSKVKQKVSQEIVLQQSSKFEDIKLKILDAKQKIQRQKLQLKKKATVSSSQFDSHKQAKKINPLPPPPPPTEKHNKKIPKFTFF